MIFEWILLGLYFLSFVIMNLESQLEKMQYEMMGAKYDKKALYTTRIVSLIPFLNTIVVVAFYCLDDESTFFFEHNKIANRTYQCKDCGVVQRRYQQGIIKYYKTFYMGKMTESKLYDELECKECSGKVERTEKYDKMKIEYAEKIGKIKSTVLFVKVCKQMKNKEQFELNKKQRESYQKLQEIKNKEFVKEKMEN